MWGPSIVATSCGRGEHPDFGQSHGVEKNGSGAATHSGAHLHGQIRYGAVDTYFENVISDRFTMATRPTTLDTTQLAKLTDISPGHVRKLAGEGIFERARDEAGKEIVGRWEMLKNNHAYIHHLRQQARWDDSSETRRAILTNRKIAAEAELAELRLRREKGELHGRDDVEFYVTNMITRFKSRIQAIPSRTSRLLQGQTDQRKIRKILEAELELALRELSVPDSKTFARIHEAHMTEQGYGADILAELTAARGATNGETDQVTLD